MNRFFIFLIICLFISFSASGDGIPEININEAAQKHILESDDIYLVSLIKTFKNKKETYLSGRIVKVYKGELVPCYSIIVFSAPGCNWLRGKNIHNNNGDVIIVSLTNTNVDRMAGDGGELLYIPKSLDGAKDIVSQLVYDIPPKSGLFFLPQKVKLFHVCETELGSAMLKLLESK